MNIPRKYLTEKVILVESKLITADNIFKLLLQDINAKTNMTPTRDPNFNYYKMLADRAGSGHVQGKHGKKSRVDLGKIELSHREEITKLGLIDHYNSLSGALNALQELMEQRGGYDPNNKNSNIIQITTLELLCGYLNKPMPPMTTTSNPQSSGEPEDPKDKKAPTPDTPEMNKPEPNKPEPDKPEPDKPDADPADPEVNEPEDTKKQGSGIDWTAEKAKRLANANGVETSKILEKFYDDYFSQEFAGVQSPEEDTNGIVSKLKSLSKILVQECTKLGYNPEVNPLVQFLKILIRKKPEIFNKLTQNTYGAIHNSYADKKITGNELGNYNEKHLLFCEDLYSYRGLEIVKYLQLYRETLNKAKDQSQDAWDLTTKIFIQQDLGNNTEDNPGPQAFTSKVSQILNSQEVVLPTAAEARLRALSEIEELFTYIFKAAPSKTKKTENKTLKLIIDSAKEENVILDMIYYIANQTAFSRNYPEDATKTLEQLEELQYKPNEARLDYCKQVIGLYQKKIAREDWRALLKKLFTVHSDRNEKAST